MTDIVNSNDELAPLIPYNVAIWHEPDIPPQLLHVRYRVVTGPSSDAARDPLMTLSDPHAVDYNEFRCPVDERANRDAPEHQYDLIGECELLTQL